MTYSLSFFSISCLQWLPFSSEYVSKSEGKGQDRHWNFLLWLGAGYRLCFNTQPHFIFVWVLCTSSLINPIIINFIHFLIYFMLFLALELYTYYFLCMHYLFLQSFIHLIPSNPGNFTLEGISLSFPWFPNSSLWILILNISSYHML